MTDEMQFLRKYTKQFIDKNGNTLLHKAVKNEDFVLLYKAAALESSINKQNKDGNTALHYAVSNGNATLVEAVLQCGVNPLLKNKCSQTASDIAQQDNKTEITKIIDSYSPGLESAIANRNTSKIIELLKMWISLSNVSKAMVSGGFAEDCSDIIRSLHLDYYNFQNDFIHLVAADEFEQIQLMLQQSRDIDINAVHLISGFSPLAIAIRNHNVKMVNLLLEYGADTKVRLSNGTPLTHYAWSIQAPFPIIISLLRNKDTWHTRSPDSGLTILFSLSTDSSMTAVHIQKMLNITKCQLLKDTDFNGKNFINFCREMDRLDLIDAAQESLVEMFLSKEGKLNLLIIAISLLEQNIFDIPENNFSRVFIDEQIESVLKNYRQFKDNICKLEGQAKDLFDAIKCGDILTVKKKNVADFINKDGRTALHEAILVNHFDIAQWLVAERPQLLRISDRRNRYPLHYAYGVVDQFGKKFVHLLLDSQNSSDLETLTDMNNKIPSDMKTCSFETDPDSRTCD